MSTDISQSKTHLLVYSATMGRKVKVVVDVTELGRLGGTATAANRTPEERSEAARKAVTARWAKKKAEARKKAGK
jgi:hypothetical protein